MLNTKTKKNNSRYIKIYMPSERQAAFIVFEASSLQIVIKDTTSLEIYF